MTPQEHIALSAPERRELLTRLHEIILENDPTVNASVGPMMGKEMILYCAPGTFKYGLASGKSYMSLHCLPIYCHPPLYARYQELLSKASFQKGCINFRSGQEVPLEIIKALIVDCAKIDLKAIREEQLALRKKR